MAHDDDRLQEESLRLLREMSDRLERLGPQGRQDFERLREDIRSLDGLLRGSNGNPGVLTRLDRLERSDEDLHEFKEKAQGKLAELRDRLNRGDKRAAAIGTAAASLVALGRMLLDFLEKR